MLELVCIFSALGVLVIILSGAGIYGLASGNEVPSPDKDKTDATKKHE